MSGLRKLVYLVIAILVAALIWAGLDWIAVQHWLSAHTGTGELSTNVYYNFWSGFGSDLGELTLVSAVGVGVYTAARKVNCHTKGCWRIGHHKLEGTPYILCRHHHPDVPTEGASHEHILAHYDRVHQ